MPSSDLERPASAAGAAPDGLKRKLVWVTVFRTVATTSLLAVAAWRLVTRAPETFTAEDSVSFALVGAVYFLNLVYGVWIQRGSAGRAAAYVQVLGDVLVASSLVYLTGGADSPFTFVYLLAIVAGAILLSQHGAAVAAGASAASFLLLLALIQEQVVRPPSGGGPLPPEKLAFAVAANVLAQVLIAILASYLGRQVSATGRRLFAKEADLRQLEKVQRQIVSSIPSGLITITAEGRITFINRAAAAILGLSGGPWPQEIEAAIPGVLQLVPGVKRGELRVVRGDRELILGIAVTPLEDGGRGYLLIFQDLTELRRAEETLRRTDRLAELGALSAQLAHEIRNPLAAMRGAAQMLAVGADPPAAEKLSRILLRETDRLTALVQDFLQFARPPTVSAREISLGALVQETVEMLRTDPAAGAARIQVEANEVRALVDPDQVRQVLLNLLRNALSAVGPGGQVRVGSALREGRPAVRVWDSAGAIPRENLKRIFDPFFSTREGGTGLGLSTAQAIVTAHRGTIEVTSSPASGTEFVVCFPAAGEGADAHPGR